MVFLQHLDYDYINNIYITLQLTALSLTLSSAAMPACSDTTLLPCLCLIELFFKKFSFPCRLAVFPLCHCRSNAQACMYVCVCVSVKQELQFFLAKHMWPCMQNNFAYLRLNANNSQCSLLKAKECSTVASSTAFLLT